MLNLRLYLPTLIVVGLWCRPAPALAVDAKPTSANTKIAKPQKIKNPPKVPLRLWTSHDGGKKIENIYEDVDIGGLYFDGLVAYDIQYESTLHFKGLRLRDLISQYKPIPQDIDFMLLHSKQGMIIPVAINDLRKDTEVFIALAVQNDQTKSWSTDFPSSVYSQPDQSEKISLSFVNNKMVVGKNWRHTDFAITPWRFFDSLAGIEFVSSIEYYKALQAGGQNSNIGGRSVYMRRCQYCHGLDGFGAKFAPNFASIIPDDKAAAVELIMKKVVPAEVAGKPDVKITSRMPKQNDFTKSDAKDLASWLQYWKKSNAKAQ